MKDPGLLMILVLILSVISGLLLPNTYALGNEKNMLTSSINARPIDLLSLTGFPQNVTARYDAATIAEIMSLSLFIRDTENKPNSNFSPYLGDLAKEFGEKLKQRVDSNVPLVINYNESSLQNEAVASPQLLSAVWLYEVTGNKTYLKYATETAKWLNQPNHKQFLFFWCNTTSKQRAHVSTAGFDIKALIALSQYSSRFLKLTNWALNEFHRIFVPQTNLSYVSVHYDATPDTAYADLGSQANCITLFSYAYYVTKNMIYKQWAKDLTMAFWSRKSAINLTPAYLDQNGTAKYDYVKEDQHAGSFLLALESAYEYTRDDYYKQIINTYARAVSNYFWNPTLERFMYRVNWGTGNVMWGASVHGFSVLDMGLVNAYLLTGNQMLLDRAESDYFELIVYGHILNNGLIVHAVDNHNRIINNQSNWEWNKYAFPAGLIFYILTKSKTYLYALNTLYTSLEHHWKTHGYTADIDSFTFAPLGSSFALNDYVPVLNAMLHLGKYQ